MVWRFNSFVLGLEYNWIKEFLEAGKRRLGGDIKREATTTGVLPEKLIGKTISLEESVQALLNMNSFTETGVMVINKF